VKRFIVLLTDFGLKDGYAGTMKGVISTINPEAIIHDLTHGISPQDVKGASVVLSSAYRFFPRQSIFVAVVDPEVGSERPIIALKTESYIFLAPDNGLLSLVAERENVRTIVKVMNRKFFLKDVSSTFHGRDIFAPVAAYLSLGVRIQEMGMPVKDMVKLALSEVRIVPGRSLTGKVIYIDRFGNIITNISKENFSSFTKTITPAGIIAEIKRKTITRFADRYNQGLPDELIILKGSSGYLEISINKGRAADKIKALPGDMVEIKLKI
jgi:S-adenosylmethionine hydrolase